VLQCGADAVEEDPLSRLTLSNNAHWDVLRGLMELGCPRLLVLGGGGYNPWSVGRLWTGVWATLNGHHPRAPAEDAEDVLRALRWDRARKGRSPPEHWFTTLRDAPRPGPVRPEITQRIRAAVHAPAARGRYFRSFDSGLTYPTESLRFSAKQVQPGVPPCRSSPHPPPRPARPCPAHRNPSSTRAT
jgi:hypothetical protein